MWFYAEASDRLLAGHQALMRVSEANLALGCVPAPLFATGGRSRKLALKTQARWRDGG
jgi:hypothetical protein